MSEFHSEINRGMVVATARELLTKFGPHFLVAVEAYLKAKYGETLELAGRDPELFYDAVKDLFGEFAAVMFLQSLVRELHLSVEEESEEGLLKALKSYVGE
ncbi:NitrOD5 domain-containing protein [Thermococcus pacificus]|uniref:Nitrosopumilus output domain-containing protein n=1 Tax=Thermococcus pacificus TaxID=71998 RepID=A0A218P6P9_9EURY|nr:NitrOD5 domain-containing protein [Thermococcus pacificus]ASJ06462.1 hypothetical protein A3L08_03515 [Thermococcus pacificus]